MKDLNIKNAENMDKYSSHLCILKQDIKSTNIKGKIDTSDCNRIKELTCSSWDTLTKGKQ